MIITKAPFRVSLFGGSTDYRDFYERNGSLIIGTTIDKYVYSSIRFKPLIISDSTVLTYSKREEVKNISDIQHPLIREILKYYKVNRAIDLHTFSDIPQRSGLGGSSSFAVAIIYALRVMMGMETKKKILAKDAIIIERDILKEPGGIQDQIWASYGGINSIHIDKNGCFDVRPLPVCDDFVESLENSLVMVYTNHQRKDEGSIARSHENKDKTSILQLAEAAYTAFKNEDIETIGKLLLESWNEKKKISNLITNQTIVDVGESMISAGAYGVKLLGSGGAGFMVGICDPISKKRIIEIHRNDIFDVKFENVGVSSVYKELSDV